MSNSIYYDKELELVKKKNNELDSVQLLESNQNVNALVIDTLINETIIDASRSNNVVISLNTGRLELHENYNDGIIVTLPIEANDHKSTINNIVMKVYGEIPPGANLQYYILDSSNREYPIKNSFSQILDYLNLENLNTFRLKIKFIRSANGKTPFINTYSIFFRDNSVV